MRARSCRVFPPVGMAGGESLVVGLMDGPVRLDGPQLVPAGIALDVLLAAGLEQLDPTHMCRGNFRSSWVAQGGYDFVADALFNELTMDGFFMEFDDERSGRFAPLRFVPKGKYVVLGLVTSKKGELEAKDDIKRRIEEASKFVDIDQLCLSPQCGFSSTLEGNSLSRDQQIAKLRLVVEAAEEVWGAQ